MSRLSSKKGYHFLGFLGGCNFKNTLVKFNCSIHGDWDSSSIKNVLINGVICPLCAKNKSMTTEDFIKKAEAVHGDMYDYSETVYTRSSEKLSIRCKNHGYFLQFPANHLKGSGCHRCYRQKVTNKFKDFIKLAEAVHGKRYTYIPPKTTTLSSSSKIAIICPLHGKFYQNSRIHLAGHGCRECAKMIIGEHTRNKNKLREPGVIFRLAEKFRKTHKNTYSYDFDNYNGYNIPMIMVCKTHGEFKQSPSRHVLGSGCPLCAGHSQRQCYLHQIFDGEVPMALKFGIAKNWIARLRDQNSRNLFRMETLGVWEFEFVKNCKNAERECKKTLKTGVLSAREMKDGWTETVSVLDLEKVIAIYEKHGGKRIK